MNLGEKGAALMLERTMQVKNPHGLHARPAALFVQKAGAHSGAVRLIKGDKEVDAKSILSVMSLGIEPGESILIRVEGEKAESVMDALQAIVEDESI
jgi:phosphotransferase system HPr (HPr) family protein